MFLSNIEKKYSDWTIEMLGDGKLFSAMKQLANKYELRNVVFCGRVNPQDYYEKASILVQTSAFEAYPLVLIEAMNNGVVPVVFDSYPAAKEIIEDGVSGMLATPFEVESMYMKLDELMSDDNKLKTMQEAAKERGFIAYPDTVYSKWNSLFEELQEK